MGTAPPWSAVAFALLAILVLAAPGLAAPFHGDDYLAMMLLKGTPVTDAGPLDLYRFASGTSDSIRRLVSEGWFPWWTHESLKIAFFRPLASALLQVQYALFDTNPVGYRVVSVALFSLLILAVSQVYGHALRPASAAFAIVLFSLDDAHWESATWLCNQHAPGAAAFGAVALAAHLRRGTDGRIRHSLMSTAALALGLLFGETAVQAAAYLVAYEALNPDRLTSRAKNLGPVALLLLLYAVAYVAFGYGVRNTEAYLQPFASPDRFMREAATAAPLLLSELVGGFPAIWGWNAGYSVASMFSLGACALALLVCYGAGRPYLNDADARAVRWMALGTVLSLLPVLGAPHSGRLVLVPSIGFFGIVSVLLSTTWDVMVVRERRRSLRGIASISSGVGVAVGHILLAPIAFVYTMVIMGERLPRAIVSSIRLPPACAYTEEVVILRAAGSLLWFGPWQAGIRSLARQPVTKPWLILSTTYVPLTVSRAGADVIEVSAGGAPLVSGVSGVFRSNRAHIPPNYSVSQSGHVITAVDSRGGHPRTLRVQLKPNTCVTALTGRRLERLSIPDQGSMIVPI